MDGASAPQPCAQHGVYVGVIALEHAEFEFVGSGSRVASVDGVTFDEMIAPHASEEKRPGYRAADSAGLVLDREFTEMLWANAGCFWIVPAATDCDGGIRGGHGEAIRGWIRS